MLFIEDYVRVLSFAFWIAVLIYKILEVKNNGSTHEWNGGK